MKIGLDWFLVGLAAVAGLAWLVPGPGAHGGALHPELLNKLGVALIFFLHGLLLSFAALKAGSLRWPLHLVVQACTFLLFPLLGLAGLALAGDALPDDLRLGFFFLCALPSTVSSSVAFTATARGNVPAAVFNATLSSLLGVFLTPLWMGLALRGGSAPLPVGRVMLDLLQWLLLPLLLGQLARPLLGAWAARHSARLGTVDKLAILLLVYTSFCDSVVQGTWSAHGPATLLLALGGAAALFVTVLLLVNAACRLLGFAQPDRVAVVFCGSKKTLASGVPMAQLMFAGNGALSVILLPLMIYHPLQLLLCGALAARWSRRR
ncbi:MAG TPA: bile acid:sodium symporter family protein [Planctomycetota bacterium]|nr:bile acid:sodium symporter family protein [Planctomycetota bacterium]